MNVDHTQEFLSFLSFCTGYGGIEIGVERSLTPIPLKAISLLEVEAFAITNLVAKMEEGLLAPAPIWTDIKTFHAYAFRGLVDILMAGYPCQPFSNAGKRKGKEDPRHLWPWIEDHIKAFLPTVCFFENVPGHISLGLREVLTDLAALGYRVDNDEEEPTVGIFSAEECGAPHRRERLFILAYRECSERWPIIRNAIEQNWSDRGWEETPGWARTCCPALADTDGPGGTFRGEDGGMGRQPESNENISDTGRQGLPSPECKNIQGPRWRLKGRTAQQLCGTLLPARPGESQHWWEEPRLLAHAECQPNCAQKRNKDEGQNPGGSTGGIGGQGAGDMADTGLQRQKVSKEQAARLEQQGLRDMADAPSERYSKRRQEKAGTARDKAWVQEPERQSERPVECQLGRTAYGALGGVDPVANRVDRLRLCGNGVYPDTAEKAFYTLMNKVINPNLAYVAPSVQLELFG